MQYVYIHGFGTTGANSSKFKKIQAHAQSKNEKAIALEWNEHQKDILSKLIAQLENAIDYNIPTILIGSSTGGNFTYQIINTLKNEKFSFVLLNPLLNVEQRKIDNELFTKDLANQLKDFPKDLSNGLIILGANDEILDYNYTFERTEKLNKIVVGHWNHTLSNLEAEELLNLIDSVKK